MTTPKQRNNNSLTREIKAEKEVQKKPPDIVYCTLFIRVKSSIKSHISSSQFSYHTLSILLSIPEMFLIKGKEMVKSFTKSKQDLYNSLQLILYVQSIRILRSHTSHFR